MDTNKLFQKLQKKATENLDYIKNISLQEQEEIEENKKEISKKVKELLDKKGINISDINTSFHKNFKTKDEEVIDAYVTVYTSSLLQKASTVVTSSETMEMLYIRTSVTKFLSIEDFFDTE